MNEYYRFPDRVGIPIFLLIYSYLIFVFIINKLDHSDDIDFIGRKPKLKCERLLNIFYIAVLILGVFIIKWEVARIHSKQSDIHDIVNTINELPSNSIVMFQPARGLEPVYLSPLKNMAVKSDINIITGGWNIFSERYYYQIQKAGAKTGQDLLLYTITSDRLYLVMASNSYKRCVATYFKEHYKGNICWSQVAEVAERTIYKITSKKNRTQRRKLYNKYPGRTE